MLVAVLVTAGLLTGGVVASAPRGATASAPTATNSVTFTETGLPSGTFWYVALAAVTNNAAAPAPITFSEPNGQYNYTISAPGGYSASPASGTVSVSGAPVSVPVQFTATPPPTYTVAFVETGLPVGTNWSVTLGGTSQVAMISTIWFSEPNGTFVFAASAPNSSYIASPASGTVTVYGAAVTLAISFAAPTYPVVFFEIGLPTGTLWFVNLATTGGNSTGTSITFNEPNGGYPYTVSSTSGYSPSVSSGMLVVAGRPVSVNVSFQVGNRHDYNITFLETGLPVGTSWSVSLGMAPATTSSSSFWLNFSEPNGSYWFAVGSVAGYAASPSSGTVFVVGTPVSESISFTRSQNASEAVTFVETGLPSGTPWYVRLGGWVVNSTASTMTLAVPNGSFAYAVGPVPGYSASPATGTVTVNGTPVAVTIAFTASGATTYPLTFAETGLSLGWAWSVTINGRQGANSTTQSIVFQEPNGSYNFTVGSAQGYIASPASGTAFVAGAGASYLITFTATGGATYTVAFVETGLPAGTLWTMALGGVTRSSTTSTATFSTSNGSYAYAVGAVAGFAASPPSGTVTVAGAAVSVAISFAAVGPAAYAVTFSETGLPAGLAWSVTLGGATVNSSTASIAFREPNGTYPYVVASGNASWQTTVQAGTLTVAGQAVTDAVAFVFAYPTTFEATGAPSGVVWFVNLTGNLAGEADHPAATSAGAVQYSVVGRGTSAVFSLPNGTYSYRTSSTSKTWTPTPSGALTVYGASPSPVSVGSSGGGGAGAPGIPTYWIVAGGLVVLAAASAVAYLRFGRPPRSMAQSRRRAFPPGGGLGDEGLPASEPDPLKDVI